MKKICSKVIGAWLLSLFCLTLQAENRYIYQLQRITFEILETEDDYVVACYTNKVSEKYRGNSAKENSLRLHALDLIGAYQIFQENYASQIEPRYFQLVVDGIDLRYHGVAKEMKKEYRIINGISVLCFVCPKGKYQMECATYKGNKDLLSLMEANYEKHKTAKAATMLYGYDEFSSRHYIHLQEDFHKGNADIPRGFLMLQQIEGRFEHSVYMQPSESLEEAFLLAEKSISQTEPYHRFCLEELVTSAPLKKKKGYYRKWQESMQLARTVWEDALYYCSQEIEHDINDEELKFSDVVSAFPGAVSSFGMRQMLNNEAYAKAVKAYANLDFQQAAEILRASIDAEGISSKSLNLLGASYRFLNKPHDALPFLILAFQLNPKTMYLVGNIALCLNMMDYPDMEEICNFLMHYAVDEWSKNEIKSIIGIQ